MDIEHPDGRSPRRDAREDDEMSTGTLSDLDVRVREDAVHQLDCDPVVDASGIGVTLTGRVGWLYHARDAETAVRYMTIGEGV
ncbi:MAG TPA: hypothetical protein VFO21_24890 [Vicinamibacterales bacterium]|nr:hypothetical protein [Vicinamibacterales bacterium]